MSDLAVQLEDVGVRYRRSTERIRSFKEYAIRRLTRPPAVEVGWAGLSRAVSTSRIEFEFGAVLMNGIASGSR